jgi:hypothetical protein
MVTMFPPVLQLQPECSQDAPFTNHIPSPISQILKRPGCWEMTVQIFSWQNSRVSNRNLLNLRKLHNLRLNLFSVFGFNGEISGISRARPPSLRFGALGRDVKNTEGWPRRSLAKSGRRAEQTLERLNVSPESAPETFLRLCTCAKAFPY